MSTSKPKGLGRGLSALMANIEPNVEKSEDSPLHHRCQRFIYL